MIFVELKAGKPSQLRILSELAVFPACKPTHAGDPKSPVPGGEQAENFIGWEALIRRRLPADIPDAIEAEHAEPCPQPEIAIGRLSNIEYLALGKSLASFPRGVRVL